MGCFRDFTTGVAKYIIFFFYLIILACACALIALGVIYRSDNGGLDIWSMSSLTIAVGVLIALISFFGCCGAIKENSCMLTTYAVILLTLFILQVVLGILIFLSVKDTDQRVNSMVHDHLKSLYDKRDQKDNLELLNAVQSNLKCCGLNGPTGEEVRNATTIMQSCCSKNITTACTINEAYQQGCVSALTDFIQNSAKTIGIIALVFAAIELLCAIFAFYVRNTIKGQGYHA